MTVSEKCEKTGLQYERKVVYNQSIAVTPACPPNTRAVTQPVNTNKKEDCSER
ncbi:hypothetical protein PS850_02717 [Pseudomonas fluorescens]|nr:hypothetical protein PS850_02717 [Pseudomonas fluorescens]